MPITQLYTAIPGDVITAARWNNEFGNLYANTLFSTGTLITATGSTTPRILNDRFADVFNVLDYGATGDGATNDTAAIQLAFDAADAAGRGIVYFPPLTYKLSTGPVSLYGSNIVVSGYGATIDCAGGNGAIQLDVVDQSDIAILGLEITTFLQLGFGIPVDGSANATLKRRITVKDCYIHAGGATSNTLHGIGLSCETYGVKIINNALENIVSTSTTTGGSVYGIIVGRKADSLSGSRTGELGSYGYDNSDIFTAEGSSVITGNTVRKVRGQGSVLTDIVAGILADGWRCVVSDNIVEDVQYVGAGVFGSSGHGIYMRGRENICVNNALANCTASGVEVKTPTASTTWEDSPQSLVAGNTFGGLATLNNTEAAAKYGIRVISGQCVIKDNYFSRWKTGAGGNIISISGSDVTKGNITIADNVLDRCTADNYILAITGHNCIIKNNSNYRPLSSSVAATGSRWINWVAAATGAKGCEIEGNVLHIDDAYFAGGTPSQQYGIFVDMNSVTVHGITVKHNRFTGWGNAAPTQGIWNLIRVSVNGATSTYIDVSDNTTDALFRGVSGGNSISTYSTFVVSGAGTVPVRLRRKFDFQDELTTDASGTVTLLEDESGATFANVGAAGAWAYVLPVSVPGLEFGFRKVVNQAVTVDPNGTEIINAGSAGGILTLTNVGSCVYLKCFVAGTWIVTESNGAYTVA